MQGCNKLQISRELERVSEESWFFKLSAFQTSCLSSGAEHPDFASRLRANEYEPSRQIFLWSSKLGSTGVFLFPDESQYVTYVWLDAFNYHTSCVGYGEYSPEALPRKRLW